MKKLILIEDTKINESVIPSGSMVYVLKEESFDFIPKDNFISVPYFIFLNDMLQKKGKQAVPAKYIKSSGLSTNAISYLKDPKFARILGTDTKGVKKFLLNLINLQRKHLSTYYKPFVAQANILKISDMQNYKALTFLGSYIILQELLNTKQTFQCEVIQKQWNIDYKVFMAVLNPLTDKTFNADAKVFLSSLFPPEKQNQVSINESNIGALMKTAIQKHLHDIIAVPYVEKRAKQVNQDNIQVPTIYGSITKASRYESVMYQTESAGRKELMVIGFNNKSNGAVLQNPLLKGILNKIGGAVTKPFQNIAKDVNDTVSGIKKGYQDFRSNF